MSNEQFNSQVQADIRRLIAKAEKEYEAQQARDEYTPGFCQWLSSKIKLERNTQQ